MSSPNTRSSAGSTRRARSTGRPPLSVRYTSLHFSPDLTGDLLYNGIAQDAFKSDTALGWQTDASYKLNAAHTVRVGLYFQHDSSTSDTTSQVLPVDANGMQTSDVPLTIVDNGTAVAGDRERLSAG